MFNNSDGPPQYTPKKEQKSVAVPAAAALHPPLLTQPGPPVAVYKPASALHGPLLSQVKGGAGGGGGSGGGAGGGGGGEGVGGWGGVGGGLGLAGGGCLDAAWTGARRTSSASATTRRSGERFGNAMLLCRPGSSDTRQFRAKEHQVRLQARALYAGRCGVSGRETRELPSGGTYLHPSSHPPREDVYCPELNSSPARAA